MLMSQLALRQWSRSTMGTSRSSVLHSGHGLLMSQHSAGSPELWAEKFCSHRVLHYGHWGVC
jgi:hypothetical protein